MRQWLVPVCLLLIVLSACPVSAGPPFRTDDPEPVDFGHWELYGFSAGTHVKDGTSGALVGVEVNYGAASNLQLHFIAPASFDSPANGSAEQGLGDIELGAKYRLVTPDGVDWYPQVGTFPLLEIPTGDAQKGLGGGHLRAFLPIWLQKGIGRWKAYGGGGYWFNPGTGNRDYWFAGWLLQYQLTPTLALGAEVFHQTDDSLSGGKATGFNFGGIYDFTEHYHLLFSGGRGLQHPASTNQASWYLALQSTF